MTPIEVLTATRTLLAEPNKWTQGSFARTTDGLMIEPEHELADCFCILGAFSRVTGRHEFLARKTAKDMLRAVLPQPSIASFNDHPNTTHQDVLNVLDKAIAHHEQH